MQIVSEIGFSPLCGSTLVVKNRSSVPSPSGLVEWPCIDPQLVSARTKCCLGCFQFTLPPVTISGCTHTWTTSSMVITIPSNYSNPTVGPGVSCPYCAWSTTVLIYYDATTQFAAYASALITSTYVGGDSVACPTSLVISITGGGYVPAIACAAGEKYSYSPVGTWACKGATFNQTTVTDLNVSGLTRMTITGLPSSISVTSVSC